MAGKIGKSRLTPFVVLLLAWLVPGAGHAYLGKVGRGIIIFVVIGATFWAGMAIGGVMTVDYQNERWWFAAEMMTGVHGLIGYRRQRQVYKELAADPDVGPLPSAKNRDGQRRWAQWAVRVDDKLAEKNLALSCPTDTVARAYAGVAGLLNLMCAFDAVMLALLAARGAEAQSVNSPKHTVVTPPGE